MDALHTAGAAAPALSPAAARIPAVEAAAGRYTLRLARGEADVDAVLRLRYEVFNLELGEGLAASRATGRDEDAFDPACHHLMVEDLAESRVVGTYRMQTAAMAAAARGFYAATEFDLSAFPAEVLDASVEVGRACIAKAHRSHQVLFLLWRGLAAYVAATRMRYLFGCCSLTSQDPAAGALAYESLRRAGHLHPALHARPLEGMECAREAAADSREVALPILFTTYLRHGAKVCGPPAIDRTFGTIDFLTLLDVQEIDPSMRRTYFGSARRRPEEDRA